MFAFLILREYVYTTSALCPNIRSVMNTRTKKQPKTSFFRLIFGYFLLILHKSSFFLDHMKPLFSGLFEEKYTHKNEGFENFSKILFSLTTAPQNLRADRCSVSPFGYSFLLDKLEFVLLFSAYNNVCVIGFNYIYNRHCGFFDNQCYIIESIGIHLDFASSHINIFTLVFING